MDGIPSDKLDRLAAIVTEQAEPDDLLLFCDGDAFPIAAIGEHVLDGRPLAAIRRDENLGEQQPHPCFCLTTVGFWNEIGGTWTRGYTWKASNGEEITEVGGEPARHPHRARDRVAAAVAQQPVRARSALVRHLRGPRVPPRRGLPAPGRPPARTTGEAGRAESVEAARCRRVSRCSAGSNAPSATASPARRAQQRTSTQRADADRQRADEVFAWIRNGDEFSRRFLEPNGLVPGPAAETAP